MSWARQTIASAALLAGTAGGASAATVASYSAEGFATVELISAYLSGTQIEAWDRLVLSAWQDESDVAEYYEGSATTEWRFLGAGDFFEPLPPGGRYGFSARTAGRAEKLGERATSWVGGWYTPAFHYDDQFCFSTGSCDAAPSVELTLSYQLGVEAQAAVTGPPKASEAEARAEVSFDAVTFEGPTAWFDADYFLSEDIEVAARAAPHEGTGASDFALEQAGGVFSVTLRPYQSVGVDLYVAGASGSAQVAPIPLPASLPLMAAGLAALGWAARRRR